MLRIDHDEEARTAVLSIGDNGRGMEPDTAEGIGPQMIRALARQLDAETTQSAPPRRAARRWT